MTISHKKISIIITAFLSVFIILFLLIDFSSKNNHDVKPVVLLKDNVRNQCISPWFNSSKQEYTYFLPSYTNSDNVTIVNCKLPNLLEEYDLFFDQLAKSDTGVVIPDRIGNFSVRFLKSNNVHTLYIDLSEAELEKVHLSKGYASRFNIRLVDPSGEISYCDTTYSATIKGHGNSTWDVPKKPYVITLGSPASLIGLSVARKWVLLANAFDLSNLRNKIVYDVASQTFDNWTPKAEYVDLYINGEYRGLYLLTEKIEVSDQRLNLTGPSRYLFTMTSDIQTESNNIIFDFPKTKRKAQMVFPQYISSESKLEVGQLLIDLENYILKGASDSDFDLSDYLDLGSWANRYLIDEVFENSDCGFVSSYFYYIGDRNGGKFYGGPIWDYDLSLGCFSGIVDPRIFVAQEPPINPDITTFYIALYNNNGYHQKLKELYKDQFRGRIQDLIDSKIDLLSDSINKASQMNCIRWKKMFDHVNFFSLIDSSMTPQYIKHYLATRLHMLDSVWLYDITVHNVLIQTGCNTTNQFTISDSCLVSDLLSKYGIIRRDVVWKDIYTQKEYQSNSIIDTDACLLIVSPDSLVWKEEEYAEPTVNWSKKNIVRALWLPGIILILVALIVVDYRRNKQLRHE